MEYFKEAYLMGVHPYAFHSGETSRVLGMKLVKPPKMEERPCFHVRYENGDEDFVALSSIENGEYKFVPKSW